MATVWMRSKLNKIKLARAAAPREAGVVWAIEKPKDALRALIAEIPAGVHVQRCKAVPAPGTPDRKAWSPRGYRPDGLRHGKVDAAKVSAAGASWAAAKRGI